VPFPDPSRALLGKKDYFMVDYINLQLSRHRGIGKELYERALNSLEYLAQLRDCGFDPIFKGGTAVQLLVPDSLQRLSIDLDFAVTSDEDNIKSFLDVVNTKYGTGMNRYERTGDSLPSHILLYNVYIPSIISKSTSKVELDFLLHEPRFKTQQVQIKTFFYECELLIRVPTVEALLGDKMTVIADGTIGNDLEMSALSYAKQLYDLHALLSIGTTTKDMFDAFLDVFDFEKKTRNRPELHLKDALESITHICQIIAMVEHLPSWVKEPRILRKTKSLKSGIDGLSQYTSTQLKLNYSRASVLASKLAFLCTLMLEYNQNSMNKLPSISILREDNQHLQAIIKERDQLETLIQDLRDIKKDKKIYFEPNILKKINPVALVFWHAAFFPSKALDSLT